jgi:glutaconate CoA-transferase subunit A
MVGAAAAKQVTRPQDRKPMLDKRMSVKEMVGRLEDGMTIGIGGWATRRKPMALVREILRSPLKELTIVAYGGPDVGLLCAAGKVRRLVFGFVSLDVLPLDPHFRAARQAGAFECSEYDEGMVQLGLRAAAMRLPFLPTRAGLATDVVRVNPQLRTVRSPYDDGEEFVAVPAFGLDAALLHVTEADQQGNCVILSPDPFFDDLMARAADACYVTCERLRPTAEVCGRDKARYSTFERCFVTGVAEVPFGAHPTAGVPGYGIDVPHLKEYTESTGDRWAAYRARYVDLPDHAAYLAAVGGAERIAAIPPPVF